MIDIKSSITRIVVLEMTEADAQKLARATAEGVEPDAEDIAVLRHLNRTIHNTLHPNMPNPFANHPPGGRNVIR